MTSCKGQGTIACAELSLYHRPGLPRGVNEQCPAACLHPGLFRDCSLNAAGQLQRETEGTPSLSQVKAVLNHIYRWADTFNRENALLTPAPCKFCFVLSRRMSLGWSWDPWVWAEAQPGQALCRHRSCRREEGSWGKASTELGIGLRGWLSAQWICHSFLHMGTPSLTKNTGLEQGWCKNRCSVGLGRVGGKPTWKAALWKPVVSEPTS